MVAGEGKSEYLADLDLFLTPVTTGGDQNRANPSHSQDGNLGRIDHGREVINAQRAQIGEGEGTTGKLFGGDLI